MLEHDRDEDVCLKWDDLAEQDFTNRMSESEYFHYRRNWEVSLNKSGNTCGPLRKRSDFNHALSTLNPLHRESRGQQLRPMPTGSTSNGKRHRVLPPLGGTGVNPGGLPKNSKKVKKEAACKSL